MSLVNDLSPIEKLSLSVAFLEYQRACLRDPVVRECFTDKEKLKGDSLSRAQQLEAIEFLKKRHLSAFESAKPVAQLAAKRQGGKINFGYRNEDLLDLNIRSVPSAVAEAGKTGEEADRRLATIKARFLIYALEMEGFYRRPPERGPHPLFQALYEQIFDRKASREEYVPRSQNASKINLGSTWEKNSSLAGIYCMIRRSFNVSLPDTYNVIRLYVVEVDNKDESGDHKIYEYKTLNAYQQDVSNSGDRTERRRESHGYIFDFQGLPFFFGSVAYSYIDKTDGMVDNYPEIILAHRHAGNLTHIRGLMIGHYPYLRMPAVTRVFIYREKELDLNITDLDSLEKSDLSGQRVIGNFNREEIIKRHKDFNPRFVENVIDTQYSQMLLA